MEKQAKNITFSRGQLVVIGGHEDRTDERCILKEFLRLAGGRKAKIVMMTAATDEPVEVRAEMTKVFKRHSVSRR